MNRNRALGLLLLGLVVWLLPLSHAIAQVSPETLDRLEDRVSSLEKKTGGYASEGFVLFLFAAFCALWAQNTGRNPWVWFILGGVLSVIAVIAANLLREPASPLPSDR
jgi:uncharacterized BrkB/YihY/UPF0761 family membrane protein